MYELITGWRYLHGRHRDVVMWRFALVALLTCVAGGVMIAAGLEGLGGFVLIGGMVATALFTLLSMLSVFTAVSTLGVALGVAALVVVLAVTSGFNREFQDRILGVHSHVMVRGTLSRFDGDHVLRVAKEIDPEVLAVNPFSYDEALATRGKGVTAGVAIKGVDPQAARAVLDLERHMTAGTFDALAKRPAQGELPPILMGAYLAERLKASLGDNLTIIVPFAREDGRPEVRQFRVAGIFRCGFDEYDRRLLLASLQDMRAEHQSITGVELKLADVGRANDVAEKLQGALGGTYVVTGWRDLNHSLFQALAVQKAVLVLILTLIILVAAVNVVSALTMMVTDKTSDIAILKSMGGKTRGVARVFQIVGLAIGVIGTTIGLAIGLVTCHVIDTYGYRLDSKLYMIDRLRLEVQPFEVVAVGVVALVISAVATVVPARTAAALRPVDGLRYG